MCLIFHNWSDSYQITEDFSIYRDICDDPSLPEELRDASKLVLKLNDSNVNYKRTITVRKCNDCGDMQELSFGSWLKFRPALNRGQLRNMKLKLLDI